MFRLCGAGRLLRLASPDSRLCRLQPGAQAQQRRGANAFGSPYKYDKIQDRWRDRDAVPTGWELVYVSRPDRTLAVLYGAVSCFALGLGAMLARRLYVGEGITYPVTYDGEEIVLTVDGPVEQTAGMIAVCLLLLAFQHSMMVRNVHRMYCHRDKYVAIMPRLFAPWKTRHVHFAAEDVTRKKPAKFFGLVEGRFKLGGTRALLTEEKFRTPGHLSRFLDENFDDDDVAK